MGSRAELLETLRKAASSLREVEERKMFGCEALFTRGSIFALVWKTGRIGVKLPDEGRFGELARQKGAEPWRAGPMVMAHWLLVPPALEDAKKLAPWVKVAHEMAAAGLGKLKVPKKIRRASAASQESRRGVKRSDHGGGKRETKMAAKKKGNENAIASAGEALANTPQAARTVAEEVVRAVTKVAKAAAGAAKAVVTKGKKKAGAAKKKAGAAKKKAGKAVKKVASKAKKTASKAKQTAKKK